jgi:hypothetical protein
MYNLHNQWFTCPIWTYLEKNWNIINFIYVEKIRYMILAWIKMIVIIIIIIDSLNNRWKILRQFNYRMDRARMIVTYSMLHNFDEMWNQYEPWHIILRNRREN